MDKEDFAKVQSVDIFLRYRRFDTRIIDFFDDYLDPKAVKTLHPVMEEEDLFLPDLRSQKKWNKKKIYLNLVGKWDHNYPKIFKLF